VYFGHVVELVPENLAKSFFKHCVVVECQEVDSFAGSQSPSLKFSYESHLVVDTCVLLIPKSLTFPDRSVQVEANGVQFLASAGEVLSLTDQFRKFSLNDNGRLSEEWDDLFTFWKTIHELHKQRSGVEKLVREWRTEVLYVVLRHRRANCPKDGLRRREVRN
jgi:hypothetical protein